MPVTMYPLGYLSLLPPMGEHTGTAYEMSAPPGRSYRYYTGKPLFAFGTGLSRKSPASALQKFRASFFRLNYRRDMHPESRVQRNCAVTTFNFSCLPASSQTTPGPPGPIYRRLEYSCTVTNTGPVAGDQVLLVYHRAGDAVRATASALHPVPIKQLVEFQRFNAIPPGGSARTTISMEPEAALSLTTADGSRMVYPGSHELIFSTGDAAPDQTATVTV